MLLSMGCSDSKDYGPDLDVKEVAWNVLSEKEKDTVIHNWKNAYVEEGAFSIFHPENLGEQECYAVRFNTKDDSLLGPIVIYVAKDKKTILGVGLRA